MTNYVTLKFEATALPAIKQALELYARLGCGQWETFVEYIRMENLPDTEYLKEVSDVIVKLKRDILDLSSNASFSIESVKVKNKYKIVFDIHQKLQYMENLLKHEPVSPYQVSSLQPIYISFSNEI